jgi:hypothetical protein
MSVVNLKARVNGNRPEFDVYCGREYDIYETSVWCNPYSSFKYSEEECLKKYEDYFWRSPELHKNIKNLKGKRLACWCKPKPCHCDFLCRLANEVVRKRSLACDSTDGEEEEEEDERQVIQPSQQQLPLPPLKKKSKKQRVAKE